MRRSNKMRVRVVRSSKPKSIKSSPIPSNVNVKFKVASNKGKYKKA